MDQMFDKRIWINRTMNLLEKNQDKINWYRLSENPNAIHLLEMNLDKPNRGSWLSSWSSWSWRNWLDWLSNRQRSLNLLKKNQYKIDWSKLSLNPNAIHLLEKHIDKIHWFYFLEKNKDKIDWYYLSMCFSNKCIAFGFSDNRYQFI